MSDSLVAIVEWSFVGLILLLGVSFPSILLFQDAPDHIFCLGKSKSKVKKLKAAYSPIQRLRLRYISDGLSACKHHTATLRRLLLLRKVYWSVELGCVGVLLLCAAGALSQQLCRGLLIAKAVVADLPCWIYFFLMTKHGPNGGVVWRWTPEY